MLYHYTSVEALKSILHDGVSNKGLCFWATRFDCFSDENEYRLGINTIKRLLPRLEERIRPNRRISSSFVWEDINGNVTLPLPYIVSFTDRFDNDYMWVHYGCNGSGVVLALDDSEKIVNEYTEDIVVKKCLYLGSTSDDDLYKEIENEFFNAAFSALTGPQKELAFGILSTSPQAFMALIGRYLLSYVAPRIKGSSFNEEDETRAILVFQRKEMEQFYTQFDGVVKSMGIDAVHLLEKIKGEKMRVRPNGETVYYHEMYLPSRVLARVYVKDHSLIEPVRIILQSKTVDVKVCLI